jgi:transglutaminase-like putative cysteine protease
VSARLRVLLLVCACAAIGAAGVHLGRRHDVGPGSSRSVYFRGEAIATVSERIDREHVASGAVEHVVRRVRLDALDSDTVVVDADLDADGFVRAAHYVRAQQRDVAVTFIDDEAHLIVDNAVRVPLPKRPLVLIELLPRVRITTPRDVTLVDLSSAETTSARIERRGPDIVALIDGRVVARAIPEGRRTGPGAFVEDDAPPRRPTADIAIALAGTRHIRGKRLGGVARELPPLRTTVDDTDLLPGPFIESTADAVKAFAQPLCRSALTETARVVAEAVHTRVDARETTSAPGALAMLRHGGDCDGAAALVVASMRACGFASRAVVGYRLVEPGTDSARLVPHAVAEVYRPGSSADGSGGWWRIDATVPALGDLDDVFVPVAEGLGGALSMGRVLGVLEPGDVVDGDNVGP